MRIKMPPEEADYFIIDSINVVLIKPIEDQYFLFKKKQIESYWFFFYSFATFHIFVYLTLTWQTTVASTLIVYKCSGRNNEKQTKLFN